MAHIPGREAAGPLGKPEGFLGAWVCPGLCVTMCVIVCVCVTLCASTQSGLGAQSRGAGAGVQLENELLIDAPLAVLPQEQKFCQRYDQLMEAWEKKVERIENNPRRRAKESKVREYYEKQFPEIRKQRELQERMQR